MNKNSGDNRHSGATDCYPFPADGDEPLLVQIFKQVGDPPFVCGFRGNPIMFDALMGYLKSST